MLNVMVTLRTKKWVRPAADDFNYLHSNKRLERDDRLDLLEFLARHAHIRGSIMESRHRSTINNNQNETETTLEVDADHSRWWNIVDEYLSDDERTQAISKTHQVTLIILRFESVLALHRSVLATSKKNAAYNAALQRCISASRSIINTLHKALKGFGAFDGSPGQNGYETTPLLWPSFTWAVWMSAFIIFSAATEHQVSKDVALKLADKSVQILKHLALRGTSWPEACIIAIENLKTRLRGSSTRSSTVAPRSASESRIPTNASAAAAHVANLQSSRRGQGHVDQGDSIQQRSFAQPMLRGSSALPTMAGMSTSHMYNTHYNPYPMSMPNELLNLPGNLTHHNTINDAASLSNSHFARSGTFLGIAQQSSDNPLPNDEIMHLFNGEDVPDWLGSDFGMNESVSY